MNERLEIYDCIINNVVCSVYTITIIDLAWQLLLLYYDIYTLKREREREQ